MDNEIIIRAARAEDVAHLANTMREADRAEVWASSRSTPAGALSSSLSASVMAYTLEVHGRPAAMFGVVAGALVGERATVWLLTGEACNRIPVMFVKLSRLTISRLLSLYPVLENWVDARHARAIRWLRMLGAEFEPAEPLGPDGLPFYHFTLQREGLDRGKRHQN